MRNAVAWDRVQCEHRSHGVPRDTSAPPPSPPEERATPSARTHHGTSSPILPSCCVPPSYFRGPDGSLAPPTTAGFQCPDTLGARGGLGVREGRRRAARPLPRPRRPSPGGGCRCDTAPPPLGVVGSGPKWRPQGGVVSRASPESSSRRGKDPPPHEPRRRNRPVVKAARSARGLHLHPHRSFLRGQR